MAEAQQNRIQRIGGSFAPPLDAARMAAYRELAADVGGQVSEVMTKLCDMVDLFQQTPASSLPGRKHPSGRGLIISLEADEVKRISDAVPWAEECEMYQTLFEKLPTGANETSTTQLMERAADGTTKVLATVPELDGKGKYKPTQEGAVVFSKPRYVTTDGKSKATRDAAFHLLWFAKELTLDREPMTNDQL